jgi:hypothetical protein
MASVPPRRRADGDDRSRVKGPASRARRLGGRRLGRRRRPHLGGGGRANLARQTQPQFPHGVRPARLGQHLHGPDVKRLQRGLARRLPQRADHNDREGMVMHELLEERQAIHARHLDIESQHVRPKRQDLVAGDERIRRRSHNLQVRLLGDGLGENLADDRRVIHDQDPDLATLIHRACSSSSHRVSVPSSSCSVRCAVRRSP